MKTIQSMLIALLLITFVLLPASGRNDGLAYTPDIGNFIWAHDTQGSVDNFQRESHCQAIVYGAPKGEKISVNCKVEPFTEVFNCYYPSNGVDATITIVNPSESIVDITYTSTVTKTHIIGCYLAGKRWAVGNDADVTITINNFATVRTLKIVDKLQVFMPVIIKSI